MIGLAFRGPPLEQQHPGAGGRDQLGRHDAGGAAAADDDVS